jgi:predicted ribosomally synthesized peptide with nif11-like leader
MSQEAALAAADRLKSDQAFRDEVGAAGDDAARLEVITGAGFDVVAEDKDAILAALQTSDGEVSDAQLEGVAGAGWNLPGQPGFDPNQPIGLKC